jgi:RecA-family ATPase
MCETWRRKKANGQQSPGTDGSGNKPESWRQHAMTASELQDKQFPALAYVVDELIPEGLTILAGRPKVGKSWLALDVCLAVASGTTALGNLSTAAGDVLYCALEDNFRRLRARVEKLLPPLVPWPERLTVATKWRRLDVGGVTDIAEWCGGVTEPRLVVLDTLAGIRPARSNAEAMYDGDYRALLAVHRMASERRIAVLVLHHTRKLEADDPLDAISGTLGLAGCADGALVINRTAQGTSLYMRGRDVEERDSAISFDKATCRWSILGDAAEVQRSDGRKAILAALASEDDMTPQEIAAATGFTSNTTKSLLHRMVKDAEVTKVGRGRYRKA